MMNDGSAPLFAFSTLACPGWDALTVVERAAAYGYGGIEWRGGPRGTVRLAWPARRRDEVRAAMAAAGLRSVAVTAYPNLISGDATVRQRSIVDLVDHLELARDLGAPTVRAFVGVRDDDATRDTLRGRACDGLATALGRAAGLGVGIAIEPHDDHVRAADVRPILDALPDPRLGVVWDIANAWAAGDRPATGLAAFAGRIAWVQVKDGTGAGASWRLCPLGAGEVPIAAALRDLAVAAARGGWPLPPISVEWERAWHPELDPPEVALPAALAWLRATVPGAVVAAARP